LLSCFIGLNDHYIKGAILHFCTGKNCRILFVVFIFIFRQSSNVIKIYYSLALSSGISTYVVSVAVPSKESILHK
jgi:hypothetical protein